MKQLFYIANWKEHKDTDEALNWLSDFSVLPREEQTIILCPPFTLLPIVREMVTTLDLSIHLGAQDFPSFAEGAFTGEEPPSLLKDYIDFAIIGHSERRKHFGETDELLEKKAALAISHGIKPVFCVQDSTTPIPADVSLVAYEPVFAIGTGTPDTPENANDVARTIKEKRNDITILYGGSVTEENVNGFLEKEHISGVLVGSASLEPQSFAGIVKGK